MTIDSSSNFTNLADQLLGKRVLIVGDVMLDEYVWGKARRISPEAPVPVVEVLRHSYTPGGAGNVAVNVASLGGVAILCGVVGDDLASEHLRQALTACGVGDEGLLTVSGRPTTHKSRVVANSQQIVRVDTEHNTPLSHQDQVVLLETIKTFLPQVDVCLLSDYAKGMISPYVAQELIVAARQAGKPVLVDPKNPDFSRYRGATVVTPNALEAAQASRCDINTTADLLVAARALLPVLDGSALLITQGDAGMSLFQPGVEPVHIPTVAQQVYDVTGAGDTAIAMLALALSAGAGLSDAAHLSNVAAGIVVGKAGTASVTLPELMGHIININLRETEGL